jgi:hypothetical protein
MARTTIRIDCVNKAMEHSYVLSVGTKTKDGQTTTTTEFTVGEVYAAIDKGDIFYTVSSSTNAIALVHKYTCKEKDCNVAILKSAADAVTDNNLDNISSC